MIVASLLAFAFSSFLLVGIILVKTQWFRRWSGWILAGYIGGFVSVGIYLLSRWLGWIDTSWQQPFYSLVFGGFALLNIVNAAVLLKSNWHFWAWTKVGD